MPDTDVLHYLFCQNGRFYTDGERQRTAKGSASPPDQDMCRNKTAIAGVQCLKGLNIPSNHEGVGLLAGLIAMYAYIGHQSGWEDLAGFLSFMMLTAAGFAAGLAAEAVAAVVRRLRK